MTQDLYLHIMVGRWILAHQLVPDRGILSGSAPEAPWFAHEWLASLGAAALLDHFGWNGLAAATALLLAAAIGVVAYEVARAAGPIQALAAAILAWGLCLGHVLARPHMATLPLFALWIAAHVRARRAHRAPSMFLAPVMIVWVNLHGGFLIGPAFTLLFTGEAIFEADSVRQAAAAALRWGLFLVAALAAALISPHGFAGLLFPFQLTHMTTALAGISEWQPSSLANNPPFVVWMLLFLFAALVCELRIAITRVVMILILVYLVFAHLRHSELLALAAPLLAQDALAEVRLDKLGAEKFGWFRHIRPVAMVAEAILLIAGIALSAVIVGRNLDHGVDRFTPEAAVSWAQAQHLEGPVLNAYNFGGYLVFRGVAPFIDGRVELYGDNFVTRYFALEQFAALLAENHIGWTIFEPENPRSVLLSQMPDWRRVYSDAEAEIYVRKP